MNPRKAILLSARREVRERLRSRAFLISTGVQLAIVIAIVVVAAVTGGDGGPQKLDVGYVGTDAKAVVDSAEVQQAAFDIELTPTELDDEDAARAAVEDDKVDAALAGDTLLTGSSPDDSLTALIQSASREVRGREELRREGLSESQIRTVLAPKALDVDEVGAGEAGAGIAFVGTLFLYITILTYGIVVATAVVEEKSTRVVEVILAAIRPVQLLTGKVLGIGLVGIGQVVVITGVGAGAALAISSLELPSSTPAVIVLIVVYFVLGYLMYAAAFAAGGSLVSRQEDVSTTTTPLTIILVAGYLASFSAIDSPQGTLAVVGTFLPPIAPMIVPGRAAQDALPAWELAVSLALMVAAAVALLWIAARIYDRAVLRMGAPVKLREALRLAR